MAGATGVVLLLVGGACSKPLPPVDPRFVAKWMETHFALTRAERLSPVLVSRVSAYAAVALYEGLVPGSTRLQSLGGQLNGLPALPRPDTGQIHDWQIVALTAQSVVLEKLLEEGFASTLNAIDSLRLSQIAERADQGVSPAIQARSMAYGELLGKAIAAWAATDGFAESRGRPYNPPASRQHWVSTATADQHAAQSLSAASDFVSVDNPAATLEPGGASERALLMNRPKLAKAQKLASVNPTQALEPYWGLQRPFVMSSADECAPPPPESYSEGTMSGFYKEARAVYDASIQLTEEQRQIALFWADNPGQTGTPAGHWVSIMGQLVEQLKLDSDVASEMFALTAIAIADAFISCWDEKYRSRVVRPVTYIRRVVDPNWQTVVVTPPFPEYTSGHSVQSAAAAEVLTQLLGNVAFTDNTQISLGHPPRRFSSFKEAAEQAAISRFYGGIHYPMAIKHGVAQGICVGQKVMSRVRTRKQE